MTRAARGPWKVTKSRQWTNPEISTEDDVRLYVLTGSGNTTREEDDENARLMAAAPDLYEVLRGVAALLEHTCRDSDRYYPDETTFMAAVRLKTSVANAMEKAEGAR